MALTVTSLTRVAGFHHWPGAPAHRAYLADRHRHLFHIRATVEVDHEDRQVEFHDLGALVEAIVVKQGNYFNTSIIDFGPQSCEALAIAVAEDLLSTGLTVTQVSCSEDDEFTSTWTPDRTSS